jgi:hypothetical protein
MTPISAAAKEEIYAKALHQLRAWYGPDQEHTGACIYWSQVTMKVLKEAGLRPLLQAGTLQWCMVAPGQDDGRMATHFSFVWSPELPGSRAAIQGGKLPEMHVWVALPDTQEIVDFSTGALKKLAEGRFGLRWPGPPPPKFLWGRPPEKTLYTPNREAIRYALQVLIRGTM